MDAGVLRLVVLILGAVCCLSLGGITILAVSGHEGHATIIAMSALAGATTTSLGAIIGLLVNPNVRASPRNHPEVPESPPAARPAS